MRFILALSLFVLPAPLLIAQHRVKLPYNKEVHEKVTYRSKTDNVLHGTYEFNYRNKTQLRGKYVNGRKAGTWKAFRNSKDPFLTADYENDMLHGEVRFFSVSGNVAARGTFHKNIPRGTWYSYFDDGTKRRQIHFDDTGFPVQIIDYFWSGEIATNLEQSIVNNDTIREFAEYYKNTKIARYTKTVNGKRQGKQITYHPSGAVSEEHYYRNDSLVKVGEVRTAVGKPLEASDIVEGTGSLTQHYEYGGLYARMRYKNGVLHDSIKKYQSGKVRLSGKYENGTPTGRREIYNKNFDLKYVYDFKGDTTFYQIKIFSNLENKEEGIVMNGRKNGTAHTYDGLGKLSRSMDYENGLKHGAYIENIPGTEVPRVIGNFRYGVRNGKWNYFNALGQVTYRELYDNNPELVTDLYKVPSGYTAYVPRGFDQRVNETFLDDIPVHNDIAFYIPDQHTPGAELNNFDFFSQEAPFDIELRERGERMTPTFQSPRFQGRETDYILRHMFPTSIEMPTSGAVLLRYDVDIFGVVSNVEVVRSIHPELDDAAVRLLEGYPILIPARFNGIPVPVKVLKSISY